MLLGVLCAKKTLSDDNFLVLWGWGWILFVFKSPLSQKPTTSGGGTPPVYYFGVGGPPTAPPPGARGYVRFSFSFWSPAKRIWDLQIHSRACMCAFDLDLRSIHRIFLLSCQSCSFMGVWKWHFWIFEKKSSFHHFGQKTVQKWPFGPKTAISTNFSK